MKPRAQSGYTLIELMVASSMAIIVLVAMGRVFMFGRGTEMDVRQSYLIRQDADQVFQRLQDDLRQTHLASIRVADGDLGFSMISPLQNADPSTFALTPFGVVQWKSWVHYTVLGTGAEVGDLVRWETPVPDGIADGLSSTLDPSEPNDTKQSLLTGVMLPGVGILPPTGSGNFSAVGVKPSGDTGGLRLRFVRRDSSGETLSKTNPSQQSDAGQNGWSKGTTGLVDCLLRVADQSGESGRWSVYQISFRVCPRN